MTNELTASGQQRRAMSVGLASAFLAPATAFAQSYPSQTIKLVNPNAPGGVNDVLARMVSTELQATLGQSVVVEYRPGAGGDIGFEAVSRSDPDGHTLLIGSISLTLKPALTANSKLDPRTDLTSIARIATQPMVIVLRPDFPVGTLPEFIKLAKDNPGKFTFATPGRGTPQHFGAEMLCAETGIKMNHVPYRGAAPAMTDIISGQVDLFFGTETSAGPFIKEGKMKAVAGTLSTRLSQFPDVKTLSELGIMKSEIGIWYGLFGPPKLPAPIVDKITSSLEGMTRKQDYKTRMEQLALTNALSTPKEMSAQIAAEFDKWRDVAKAAGLKPE